MKTKTFKFKPKIEKSLNLKLKTTRQTFNLKPKKHNKNKKIF